MKLLNWNGMKAEMQSRGRIVDYDRGKGVLGVRILLPFLIILLFSCSDDIIEVIEEKEESEETILIQETNEEECEIGEYTALDNTVRGCIYTYADRTTESTYTFIRCSTNREAFVWADEQICEGNNVSWTWFYDRYVLENYFTIECEC